MSTTEKKTTGVRQPTAQGQPGQPQEEMELAYQIHTLAQMLYGHLSQSHPWVNQAWGHMPTMQHGFTGMHPGLTAMQAMHPGMAPIHPLQQGIHPMQHGAAAGWLTPQQTMPMPFLQYPFGPFPR